MEKWTEDRVWDAVDAWRWVPPAAQVERSDHFELAVTPGSYALTFGYGFRSEEGAAADAALHQLRERVRTLGGTGIRLQVTPRTRPRDLDRRLEREGYRQIEEVEALFWQLHDENGRAQIPNFVTPEGVSVREAVSDADYEHFVRLSAPIFGDPPPPPETQRAFLETFRRELRDHGRSGRFVAELDGVPVGRAGLEIVGPVARFWGTGVLPEHRRRGIYGALVLARCRAATELGAEIALVTARAGTSGPILKHHGFQRVGSLRVFEARWGA